MSMAYLFSRFDGADYLDVGLDVAMKTTVLFAIAAFATQVLGRVSAAFRHRVWCLAFGGALILPLLSVVVPQWRLAILPTSIQWGAATVREGQHDWYQLTSIAAGLEAGGIAPSQNTPSDELESLGTAAATDKRSDMVAPSAVLI